MSDTIRVQVEGGGGDNVDWNPIMTVTRSQAT